MAKSEFSFPDGGSASADTGTPIDDGSIIDPATLTAGADNGAGDSGDSGADDFIRDDAGNILYSPTGRARKRRKSRGKTGSRNTANNSDLTRSVDRLSMMLAFAHTGIANIGNIPELKLDKSESDMLATSAVDCMNAFDIEVSEKAVAIAGLVTACATVYGPRVVVYNIRKGKEKKSAPVEPAVFPSKAAQFEDKPGEAPSGAHYLGG